ncbi:PGF-pre-PGF domain-containing protein [Bacteroidota bacterium]
MNKQKLILITVIISIFLLTMNSVLAISNAVITSPVSSGNYSGNILLNVTTDDIYTTNVNILWIDYTSGAVVLNTTIINNTVNDTIFENTSFDTSLLTDGVYNLTVTGYNATGENVTNTTVFGVTIDNNVPYYSGTPSISGDTDEFYIVGDVINITFSITDTLRTVQNVTVNMSQACSGITETQTSSPWTFNCTVDQNLQFVLANLTVTACDDLDNCNDTLNYSVVVYNFTFPDDIAGSMQFNQTLSTNLSQEDDLSDVNYILGIELNGTAFPWSGFQLAALLDFASVDFTDPATGAAMYNLENAIDITIEDGKDGNYGGSRIYVNSTAFAALNTTTDIELYNLPFSSLSASDITGDADAAGGVASVVYTSNGDGTGNLSFTVDGFSGYNITDDTVPTITMNTLGDGNDTFVFNMTFNLTFDGTGTEIDNSTINITVVNSTGTVVSYYFDNLTCVASSNNEVQDCYIATGLAVDTYNYTIYAADYGGASGNTKLLEFVNVGVDQTEPTITAFTLNYASPRKGQWLNGTCTATDNSGGTVTAVVTGLDTTSTGDKTATCTATDIAGNVNTSTIDYTVRRASSSGSSTSYVLPNPQKTSSWSELKPNIPVTMSITNDEIGLTEIELKVTTSKTDVQLKVEKLPVKPANTGETKGLVYKYLQITKTNFEDADVNTSTIKFKVEKTWMTDNSLAEDKISLKRFVDDEWVDLPTHRTTYDIDYYYFEAETPGFSYFAIGEKDDVALTPNPEPTDSDATDDTTTPVTDTTATGDTETDSDDVEVGADENQDDEKYSFAWLGILLIAVVLVIYFLYKEEVLQNFLHKNKLKKHGVDKPHNDFGKLDDYILHNLELGHTPDEIKKALKKVGWNEKIVSAHLKKHGKN